ncbi:pali-domain-containing protein [Trametopsis cervina]|nr:pali-domain-containing protein [Trametopsis cervina]
MFVFATPFLVFVAFLLLLLVTLSVPIIHSIYLFRLGVNVSVGVLQASATTAVKFGVWGYCSSGLDVSALGFDHDQAATCSSPHLGYNFDSNVQSALRQTGFDPNAISKGLTAVLVLHPITCGFAFLFLLASLYALSRRTVGLRRGLSCCVVLLGLLTALLSTVIFLIDVILVAVVRSRIKKDTDGIVSLGWGNAVWMTLGATVALWLALVSACLDVFRGHRKRSAARY